MTFIGRSNIMFFKMQVAIAYIQAKYWLYRRTTFKNRTTFEGYQLKKRNRQLRRVLKQSPFYAKRKSLTFEELPILTKKEWMESFDDIVTVPISKKEALAFALGNEKEREHKMNYRGLTVGLSSGTSGTKGIFIVSEKERAKWTGKILASYLSGIKSKEIKIAFYLRMGSDLYSSVESKKKQFQFFDMAEPISLLMEKTISYQPNIIVAPPSMLRLLSEQGLSKKIGVEKIITVAEVLDENDRDFFEKCYNIEIEQAYQATEGFLGIGRTDGTISINEEIIYVEKEWIDDSYFIPIITDMERIAQPIIRYRLNDIWKFKGYDPQSQQLVLEKIVGREDDSFIFGNQVIFADYISRAIITTEVEFLDFECIQLDEQTVSLAIKSDSDVWEKIQQQLHYFFKEKNVQGITIEKHEYLEKEQLEKRIRIRNNMKRGIVC